MNKTRTKLLIAEILDDIRVNRLASTTIRTGMYCTDDIEKLCKLAEKRIKRRWWHI